MSDYIEFENRSQIRASVKNGEKLNSFNDEKLKILGKEVEDPYWGSRGCPCYTCVVYEPSISGCEIEILVSGCGATDEECFKDIKKNERKVIDNLRELLDNVDPNESFKLRQENQKLRELLVETREYLDRATFGGLIQRIDEVLLKNENC